MPKVPFSCQKNARFVADAERGFGWNDENIQRRCVEIRHGSSLSVRLIRRLVRSSSQPPYHRQSAVQRVHTVDHSLVARHLDAARRLAARTRADDVDISEGGRRTNSGSRYESSAVSPVGNLSVFVRRPASVHDQRPVVRSCAGRQRRRRTVPAARRAENPCPVRHCQQTRPSRFPLQAKDVQTRHTVSRILDALSASIRMLFVTV